MTKLKYNFSLCIIVVILITLIVIRLTLPEGSYPWINAINYMGFVVAIVSLFFTFHSKYGQYKKTYPIIGVFMLLSTILIIIGVLIFTNILVPTSKANDSIMLLTLLISLPSELYIQLIGQYVKK